MNLEAKHLRVLRCLKRNGWGVDLVTYLLTRNGADPADLDALKAAGLVCTRHGKLWLSTAGKKVYRDQSKGKFF